MLVLLFFPISNAHGLIGYRPKTLMVYIYFTKLSENTGYYAHIVFYKFNVDARYASLGFTENSSYTTPFLKINGMLSK